jgi:hypothetical protein
MTVWYRSSAGETARISSGVGPLERVFGFVEADIFFS